MKLSSLSTVLLSLSLAGCAASFQPVLPDYTGENAAYLRFNNSPVYTKLRQASGQVLQPVPFSVRWSGAADPDKEFSVNARFAIMGIKSSYGKKVEGSAPVSSNLSNKSYMEYRVKAGDTYSIKWVHREQGIYHNFDRTFSGSVTPETGHTYEVTIGGGSDGNGVVITDVTSN
ncbi:hypothetical protein [Mixta intestinalis]|uniref:Lipoprotein n=1 Tax=Mixta intestinalis TaxID=1615494 RepID=A0A6P1Q4K8_9GAMM|nr:hypothetical protein [Mixta intestinalis]QHM74010.1 hypothetical protein C7M51_04371 [Mixta intestinalis]